MRVSSLALLLILVLSLLFVSEGTSPFAQSSSVRTLAIYDVPSLLLSSLAPLILPSGGWIVKSSTTHSIQSVTNDPVNWGAVQQTIRIASPIIVRQVVSRQVAVIKQTLGPLSELRDVDREEVRLSSPLPDLYSQQIAQWAMLSKTTEHKEFSFKYIDGATVTSLVQVSADAVGDQLHVKAAQATASATVQATKAVVTKSTKKKKVNLFLLLSLSHLSPHSFHFDSHFSQVFGIKTGSKSSQSTSHVARPLTAEEHQHLLTLMLKRMQETVNAALG